VAPGTRAALLRAEKRKQNNAAYQRRAIGAGQTNRGIADIINNTVLETPVLEVLTSNTEKSCLQDVAFSHGARFSYRINFVQHGIHTICQPIIQALGIMIIACR